MEVIDLVAVTIFKDARHLVTGLSRCCLADVTIGRPVAIYIEHSQCDEAHFWLNGYVNKQNCRIWSEANPQMYAEIPIHPEKLTVWCSLWAGGILLQKR
ncbi:transposable element Tc3 transposase [Trichonephila clavipes]|nr:transposable element Tc3 transposase [Trichonephila clavipes]